MKGKLIKQLNHNNNEYWLYCEELKYTLSPMAKTGVGHGLYKLSLKNCQAIENGYDLDELAENWIDINGHKWSNNNNEVGDNYGSFKEGFEKALEILDDKKYTEADILKAYNQASFDSNSLARKLHKEIQTFNSPEEYIQSLQQTEWDVEIVCHKDCVADNPCDSVNDCILCTNTGLPVKDENDCLILKRI